MKTALLVIDAQKIYTVPDSEMYCKDADLTLEKINKLIKRSGADEIIYIRHIHKSDGSDLGRMFDYYGDNEEDFNFKEGEDEVDYDDSLIISKNFTEIIKTRYSAFTKTDLDRFLSERKIEKIIICGFMTNFCCESTARDAHGLDYYVDFIVDATGTPGTDSYEQEEIREIVGEFMDEGFARTMSVDDFLNN